MLYDKFKELSAPKKRLALGTIIARRKIVKKTRAQREVKNPTIFDFVLRENRLLCVWCRNRAKKEMSMLKMSRPDKGYTGEEWDAMVREMM